MAKSESRVMSMVNINEQKALKFYSEVISLYPTEVIASYWKNETEFLDSLRNAVYREDNKEYEVDFSKLRIKFPKPIFNILFLNKTAIEFDKPIGQRLELDNYIYLELKESPLVSLQDRESPDLFFLSKKRDYWGYFYINEDSRENLYYPKEVLFLFIFQLKERLIKDYAFPSVDTDIYTDFCSLFKPIKYILKVKKHKEALLGKLLYRLCTDLGLTEYKTFLVSKIDISQKIDAIYDKTADCENETPLLLSSRKQYNLDSLRFYLSAMGNLDPSYQFLELYNALESYFYRYFYNYIKNLKKVKTQKDFKQIQEHTREPRMLKLVIKDISDKFPQIGQQINNISNINEFCADFLPDHVRLDSLNNCDEDKFSNKVADFIYSIRNNIVHTKEPHKTIKYLSESEQKTLIDINKVFLFIVQEVFSKNIEWQHEK